MWNWPNVITGFGTSVMSIAVIFTACYAIKTWKKSLKRDKQDLISKLFSEFINNGELKTGIDFLSYSIKEDSYFKSNAIELLLFFAKLGKLLKEEVISINEVMVFFYNYLFYEQRMLNIIKNLKNLCSEIPEDYIGDFNYLMNKISDGYAIKSYKNIVKNSFKPISLQKFGRAIITGGGKINSRGRTSIK